MANKFAPNVRLECHSKPGFCCKKMREKDLVFGQVDDLYAQACFALCCTFKQENQKRCSSMTVQFERHIADNANKRMKGRI